MTKIFCIGSNKTGTTSLTSLVKMYGFKPLPETVAYRYVDKRDSPKKSKEKLKLLLDEHRNNYDFFEDLPFCFRTNYKTLLEIEPEALFILTIRESEAWFYSCLNWIKKQNAQPIYDWIWNVHFSVENKRRILAKYQRRNSSICSFFASRGLGSRLHLVHLESPSVNDIGLFLLKENHTGPSTSGYPWLNRCEY